MRFTHHQSPRRDPFQLGPDDLPRRAQTQQGKGSLTGGPRVRLPFCGPWKGSGLFCLHRLAKRKQYALELALLRVAQLTGLTEGIDADGRSRATHRSLPHVLGPESFRRNEAVSEQELPSSFEVRSDEALNHCPR